MEEKQEMQEMQALVPYFIHEGQMARMERIIRILAALLVAALVLFILNNIVWMRYSDREIEAARRGARHAGVYEQSDQGNNL